MAKSTQIAAELAARLVILHAKHSTVPTPSAAEILAMQPQARLKLAQQYGGEVF